MGAVMSDQRQQPEAPQAGPRRTLSIRWRLMILAVAAIVPLLLERVHNEEFDRSECNQFLAAIAKPTPWIKTLSVANLQGRIVCSSSPEALGLDISERPHFLKAVDSGDFVLSDYYVGTRVKTPLI